MKNVKKKPKPGQLLFDYIIYETQEIVFEDDKGKKVKQKTVKDKPSDTKKNKPVSFVMTSPIKKKRGRPKKKTSK